MVEVSSRELLSMLGTFPKKSFAQSLRGGGTSSVPEHVLEKIPLFSEPKGYYFDEKILKSFDSTVLASAVNVLLYNIKLFLNQAKFKNQESVQQMLSSDKQ